MPFIMRHRAILLAYLGTIVLSVLTSFFSPWLSPPAVISGSLSVLRRLHRASWRSAKPSVIIGGGDRSLGSLGSEQRRHL